MMSWLPRLTTIVTITNLNDILPLLPVQKLDTRQKKPELSSKEHFTVLTTLWKRFPEYLLPFVWCQQSVHILDSKQSSNI